MQRDFSRALVLKPSLAKHAVLTHRSGHFCLDNAFLLIEGHLPVELSNNTTYRAVRGCTPIICTNWSVLWKIAPKLWRVAPIGVLDRLYRAWTGLHSALQILRLNDITVMR